VAVTTRLRTKRAMNNASRCYVRGHGSAKLDASNRWKRKVGVIKGSDFVAAEFAHVARADAL
jgi:hypothetical protein